MPTTTPALSPSIAHVLVSESPLHAWTFHRLLGGIVRPATDEQELGRMLHGLILGADQFFDVIDADSFRTNAAKEARDASREANRVPVLASKLARIESIAGRIGANIAKLGISLADGEVERRIEWMEYSESGDVLCSGQPDWVKGHHFIDLKTTGGSAHPDACAASLIRHGGAIQDAAYRHALESLDPSGVGRVESLFIFCQTEEPFAVTPVEFGGSMRELGERRWSRAVNVWARCLAKGIERECWPGYAGGPVRVECQTWALAQEEMYE